nr:RDD family protein [uncultured Friedmanniella sp.]
MSGIPVGSPPVPPGRHAAPSGWYADPLDPAQERYWDGWQWSRNVRAREGGAPVAPPAAAPGQPPQPGYPPSPQPGYPPQSEYPPQGGYSQQPGYPPQAYPGYPPQQDGFPQSGYPQYPQQPGYPPSGQPGYAPQGYPGYPPAQQPQGRPGQAAFTADGVPLAGWWRRVLATVVDNLVVTLLATLASLPILLPLVDRVSAYFAEVVAAAEQGLPQPVLDPQSLIPASDQFLLTAVGVSINFLYQLLFLRWRSATPGKQLCGLRVVPVDEGRATGRLSWRSVVTRALVWAAPGLNLLLGLFQLLDVLFPLWHPKRQALHDILARTQVVRR